MISINKTTALIALGVSALTFSTAFASNSSLKDVNIKGLYVQNDSDIDSKLVNASYLFTYANGDAQSGGMTFTNNQTETETGTLEQVYNLFGDAIFPAKYNVTVIVKGSFPDKSLVTVSCTGIQIAKGSAASEIQQMKQFYVITGAKGLYNCSFQQG